MEPYRQKECIEALCREHKTDGLMILGLGASVDFTMEFYNPDGSGGMMCGIGGRHLAFPGPRRPSHGPDSLCAGKRIP